MSHRQGAFIVQPHKYAENRETGEQLRVLPAKEHHGDQVVGVAVFVGPFLKFVLEADHAIALANAIADALEGQTS